MCNAATTGARQPAHLCTHPSLPLRAPIERLYMLAMVLLPLLLPPQGRVYAPGSVADSSADAVRSFNQALLADKRVEVVHVPFRDGVGLVRRR